MGSVDSNVLSTILSVFFFQTENIAVVALTLWKKVNMLTKTYRMWLQLQYNW